MGSPSDAALTMAFWLHMLATSVWLGGLGLAVWLVLPAARRQMNEDAYRAFSEKTLRQVQAVAWFCLLVLAGTGMFQMSSNPNYNGFLAIDNRWAAAILIKHVLFGGILLLSAYLTWGLGPSLRRHAFLVSARGSSQPALAAGLQALERREALLMKINLVLGVAVLVLTALARIS